jgi:hypothetical protein
MYHIYKDNDMKSCAFFGHGKQSYLREKGRIEAIVEGLIIREGVTQFYSEGRGAFDDICSTIIGEMKKIYPQIKNTLVYSYIPQNNECDLPKKYDDSVYLLEAWVPPKYAILKTNEAMIERCDFIVVAVEHGWGGAAKAYAYAKRKQKKIINIYQYASE